MNTKVIITAETSQAQAAIRSFGQELTGLTGKFSSLTGLAGTLGGALSVTAFAGIIKSSIDAADNFNDLAQKTGISIQALAGWKLAAEQSGTSLESIAIGVKGLSAYMIDHSDKLKKLGVTATDANGAMVQIADIFAKLPDGVEKSKLAVDVFGKSGMELIPMLNMGSNGLADAQEKAAEYGRRMQELAPDADKFNDQLAELSFQTSVVGINLASLVTGPMARWLEAHNEGIRIAGSATEMLRLFVFNLDAMTSEKPVEEIKRLTKALKDYQAASSVGKFMQSPTGFMFGGREDDLKKQITFLEFLKEQEERAAQPEKTTSTRTRTPEQAAAEILQQREFAAKVRAIIGEDKKPKKKVVDKEGDYLMKQYNDEQKARGDRQKKFNQTIDDNAVQAAIEAANRIADAQEKAAQKSNQAWENFSVNVQRNLGDVLYNGLNGKFDGIGELFKQMLYRMAADAAAANLTQAMFGSAPGGGWAGSLMGLFGPAKTGLEGMDQSLQIMVPGYSGPRASGGPVSGGSTYLVGERGPELFTARNSGTIVPNHQLGGGKITLNDNSVIQVDSRSDRAQVLSDVSGLIDQKHAQLVDTLRREGVIA